MSLTPALLQAVADTASARPLTVHWTEYAKLTVSALGFAGAILTILFGLRQYRRAEQWKRGEFIAKEVKEFETNATVRSVFAAIDWSERRINLTADASAPPAFWTAVTRGFLWRALLPHEVNAIHPEWREQPREGESLIELVPDGEGNRGMFTRDAALARDAFDVFFDQLGRFGNFIEAGLIRAREVRPYLGYWLTDLATDQGNADDARWRCTVLTYLFVYRFQGAITLFTACDYKIGPDDELFQRLRASMQDDALFFALQTEARKTAPAMLDVARQASATHPSTLRGLLALE
jgi:hypothetical protein